MAAGAHAEPAPAIPAAAHPSGDARDAAEPSSDAARDAAIPTQNLLGVIRDGGPLIYVLLFCSFLLLVFVFERAISLRRGRVIPGPFTRRIVQQLENQQLDREEAIVLCEKNKSPVADVFLAEIERWGRPTVEVEQAMLDAGERVANNLRKYLRLFNGIATVSPLIGLLGTVLGMISAFNSIATDAGAMGRPELLAQGISQALLTTAGGLCVAIPAYIAYLFFTSRVDRLVVDIDALGQRVAQSIAGDATPRPRRGESGSKQTKTTRKRAA